MISKVAKTDICVKKCFPSKLKKIYIEMLPATPA